MFNKKFAIFGAVIIFVFSLGSLLIVPTTPNSDRVRAETGYQWIEGTALSVLEDEDAFGLSGDNLDIALEQYEANTDADYGVGSYFIGFNCSDTRKLGDGATPKCEQYFYFAKDLGDNPPFFHNFCELDDSCGEPEAIALASKTRGCHIFTFSGASGRCTTGITINNPFRVARFVADEFGIDFANIDPIIDEDIDRAPTDEDPGGDPIDPGGGAADEDDPTCEDNFDFTGAWIVCMVLGIVDQTVDNMVNAIEDMLEVTRSEVNDDGLKTAWSYFRNIASVLLVVIGLVMIIGQAISKE
ncbi:MAG TPA: hypothetical protein PKB09_00415 [Candidatus Saccharibacteria bacterium]|nr:hypothetical protein [Candidatus Saccharibacteria bacterium]